MTGKKYRNTFSMLAKATLISISAQAFAQEGSVQLYGNIGVGITHKTHAAGGGHLTEVSNSLLSTSFWGMRGTEDLGGGMSAVFRLESGVNVDTGTPASGTRFWDRQSYVGISPSRNVTITAGRQFHAYTERVVQSLDVYNVGGSKLQAAPLALFGVNRFAGNDSRADDSIKLRFNGTAGLTVGLSGAFDDGAGRSMAFDVAQITPAYTVAAFGVKFRSPNVIAATGERPEHQVIGVGGQMPVGGFRVYLLVEQSTLDATAAGRPQQKNLIIAPGVRYDVGLLTLRSSYTQDHGKNINNVVGRDGYKRTLIASADYNFSKRTSGYLAMADNRFSGGYALDPVNIAGLGRDPAAASTKSYSIGLRQTF